MKIAITGKGGVGKTTIAALLAKEAVKGGYKVLAIDADPDANLGSHLGLDQQEITPLVELKDLIEERTGGPGFIKLNPQVEDIPDRFSKNLNGVKLLKMGTISRGGSGCACPENSFLKSLLRHILLDRDELVIVDMEAGIEHLGRGTAGGVDALVIVITPDRTSLQTKDKVKKLSSDLGLNRFYTVANKIRDTADKEMIAANLKSPLLGSINYQERIRTAARDGQPIEDGRVHQRIAKIFKALREKADK